MVVDCIELSTNFDGLVLQLSDEGVLVFVAECESLDKDFDAEASVAQEVQEEGTKFVHGHLGASREVDAVCQLACYDVDCVDVAAVLQVLDEHIIEFISNLSWENEQVISRAVHLDVDNSRGFC